jgi:hypothetical protein
MQLAIRAGPCFKQPFSLKFALMELTEDEATARRTTLLKNIGSFELATGFVFGIGAFMRVEHSQLARNQNPARKMVTTNHNSRRTDTKQTLECIVALRRL